MDEVSFWGKELSQAEVTELVATEVPENLETHSAWDDIESWWRMGEATANGTMIDMEVEDIVEEAPTVQAGGGSRLTARALADDEIAGDVYGDATVVAETQAIVTAAAVIVGAAAVGTQTIVRPAGVSPPPVTETRYIGFQPGREKPPSKDRLSVATDPTQIQRQNQSAERQISIVRRDTGTSSVPVKK
jgi:hypothetical protein